MHYQKVGIDVTAALGTYQIDRFLDRFVPRPETAPPMVNDAIIATFRYDVARFANLALIRTRHDKIDLPAWAGDASELFEAVAELQPKLERLIALSEDRDLAMFAAQLSRPLRDVNGKRTATASIVHTIEAATSLRDWIEHLEKAFEVEHPPSHVEPLPSHVAALAVKMHQRRRGKLPPSNRNGWFADFLLAAWSDFGWSRPVGKHEDDDFRQYLGRKVEEVLSQLKSAALVSPD